MGGETLRIEAQIRLGLESITMATAPIFFRDGGDPKVAAQVNTRIQRGWKADPTASAKRSMIADILESALADERDGEPRNYREIDMEIDLGDADQTADAICQIVSEHRGVSLLGAAALVMVPNAEAAGYRFSFKLRGLVYGRDAAATLMAVMAVSRLTNGHVCLGRNVSVGQPLIEAIARMLMVPSSSITDTDTAPDGWALNHGSGHLRDLWTTAAVHILASFGFPIERAVFGVGHGGEVAHLVRGD